MPESMDRRQFLVHSALAAGALAAGCRPREKASAPAAGPVASPVAATPSPPPPGLSALPYAYDALEPHLDARTMEIHYTKHHASYASNYLAAVKGTDFEAQPVEQVLSDLAAIPESIRAIVRNHGGGLFNHNLFWSVMSPGGTSPGGRMGPALVAAFGSLEEFQAQFTRAAATQFGSGWAWLIVDAGGGLAVASTPNQDNPLMHGVVQAAGIPILGLDVWEHAYYLHYQNRRADYIGAWWKVVNWPEVERRYAAALRLPLV